MVEFSYLRVWPEGDTVRVARDRCTKTGRPKPEHLTLTKAGKPTWASHPEGGKIPAVSVETFYEWLRGKR